MLKRLFIVLIPMVLLFSGCVSLDTPAGEEDFLQALELISFQDPELIVEGSQDPFLLDGEILVGKANLSLLWGELRQGGFQISNPLVVEVLPTDPSQAMLFSSSQEIVFFFDLYGVPGSTLGRIQCDQGEFLMILGPKDEGMRKIVGFKGPIS